MLFAPVIRQAGYAPALRSLDRSFERFFSDLAPSRQFGARGYGFSQDDTSWTLSLDVPGVAKDQLDIGIEGAVVRIGTVEGAPRTVRAAYELPLEIDAAASQATLENGVLTLKLAKKQPVSNAVRLTVA